jgi:acyl-CoA dehydrogenase
MTGLATPIAPGTSLAAVVGDVVREVVRVHADAVDREGRFPREAMDALRAAGTMSALVPASLGGPGCSLRDVVESCRILSHACASTTAIWAMHQIQVACLVQHAAHQPWIADYLRGLVSQQWLIASSTSETGIGGNVRRSNCALVPGEDRLRVVKSTPVISYGSEADAYLLTCRRSAEAAETDQVAVLLRREDVAIRATSTWDALGCRGTASCGFEVDGTCVPEQVLAAPFSDIGSQTMTPVSHLVWAATWLGLAQSATETARRFIRAESRKQGGDVPPGAPRLAEITASTHAMRAMLEDVLSEYERRVGDGAALGSYGFMMRLNNLKLMTSRSAVQVVTDAMLTIGISAYRNDSPWTLGRTLRDVYSAVLQINNDRILHTNAGLAMLASDDGAVL